MTKDRIMILDGLNLFLRAWAVVPSLDANGEHIGGTLGFIRTVKTLIRDCSPTKVIVVWDGEGGSRKRRGIFKEYKAGRKPRTNRHYDFETVQDSEKNLATQIGRTKAYVEMLGLTLVEIAEVEADDVIAFLARYLYSDVDKVIVSTDKDILQLIDRHTVVYSPTKKVYYSSKAFKEEYGLLPENYIFMKSLVGDGSDNIDGIKGIGPKSVVKLFPFLAERPATLQEVLDYSSSHSKENAKYEAINAAGEVLKTNASLMQLSNTIISAQAAAAIRQKVQAEQDEFNQSEFKISLLRDGIQLTDIDLFSVFKEYHARAKGAKE